MGLFLPDGDGPAARIQGDVRQRRSPTVISSSSRSASLTFGPDNLVADRAAARVGSDPRRGVRGQDQFDAAAAGVDDKTCPSPMRSSCRKTAPLPVSILALSALTPLALHRAAARVDQHVPAIDPSTSDRAAAGIDQHFGPRGSWPRPRCRCRCRCSPRPRRPGPPPCRCRCRPAGHR